MKYLFALSLSLIIFSCATYDPYEYKPMYGYMPRTDIQKKNDSILVKNYIDELGGIDSAKSLIRFRGWMDASVGYYESSIRHFNHLWLIDSSDSDPYYGFAFVSSEYYRKLDKDGLTAKGLADGFYKMALDRDPDSSGYKAYQERLDMLKFTRDIMRENK